jgi:hypothetical protein
MFFLFSGEGSTDLGVSTSDAIVCQGHDDVVGPLAIMADHVVKGIQGYSIFDVGCYGYVSERNLSNRAAQLKAAKKVLRLPGKKQGKETRYFFNAARLLSRIAKEIEAEIEEDVVAVMFRDSDGTASAGRGLWNDKSPKSLKGELAKILREEVTPELLCEKVRSRAVDIDRIKMPSFMAFRDRLEQVMGYA